MQRISDIWNRFSYFFLFTEEASFFRIKQKKVLRSGYKYPRNYNPVSIDLTLKDHEYVIHGFERWEYAG